MQKEQENERERLSMLQKAAGNPVEHARLQKIFEFERQKTKELLQEIEREHRRRLDERIQTLGRQPVVIENAHE